jgi:hypothetical protein
VLLDSAVLKLMGQAFDKLNRSSQEVSYDHETWCLLAPDHVTPQAFPVMVLVVTHLLVIIHCSEYQTLYFNQVIES